MKTLEATIHNAACARSVCGIVAAPYIDSVCEDLKQIKAEHAALVAVAEAAEELVLACSTLKFLEHMDSRYSQWAAAKDALATLAAVRQNGGAK